MSETIGIPVSTSRATRKDIVNAGIIAMMSEGAKGAEVVMMTAATEITVVTAKASA